MPRPEVPIYSLCEDLGIFSTAAQESLRVHCLQFLKAKLHSGGQKSLPRATDIDIRSAAEAFLGRGDGDSHFSPHSEGKYQWRRESDQPKILSKIVSIMEAQRGNATGKLHKRHPGPDCPGCFLYHNSDTITVEIGRPAPGDNQSRLDLKQDHDMMYMAIGDPQHVPPTTIQDDADNPSDVFQQMQHIRGQSYEFSPRPAKRRRVQEVESSVSPRQSSSKSTPATSIPSRSLSSLTAASESLRYATAREQSATQADTAKSGSSSSNSAFFYNSKVWKFQSLEHLVEALQAALRNQTQVLKERLETAKERDMLAYFDLGSQYQREIILPFEKELRQHGGREI